MTGRAGPVGVLAVQGGFEAHGAALTRLGAEWVEVRAPADLQGLGGLIIPGGESTTIAMGIEAAGLAEPIKQFHSRGGPSGVPGGRLRGGPILATCAGMILAGREHLGLIDITTRRNAFGRQLASFEAGLTIAGLDPTGRGETGDGGDGTGGSRGDGGDGGGRPAREGGDEAGAPFRAVFIRAPWAESLGDGVEVLAEWEGHPVGVREGSLTAYSFHPELSGDDRLHRLFLAAVSQKPGAGTGESEDGAAVSPSRRP